MIKKWDKLIAVLSMTALLSAGISINSFAAGWEKEGGTWRYRGRDGGYVTDTWEKSGSRYYYLDENGEMAVNTLIEYDGKKYYVDADGVRVTSQWVSIPNDDDTWGEDADSVYYFFGSAGKAYSGDKKTIDGKIYIFDDEGRMLSGWQTYGDDNDLYYLGTGDEGWAYTGWHYLEPDEDSSNEYDGMKWFYFNPANGKAYRDIRKYINGYYYRFDQNGVMEDKWVTGNPGDSGQNGAASGSSAWYREDTGNQTAGWVYTYAPDDPDEDRDKEWYYLDSKGIPFNEQAKNAFQTDHLNYNLAIRISDNTYLYGVAAKVIKNKTYLFDENGKMMTGLYYLSGVKRSGGSNLGVEDNDDFRGGGYYFSDSDDSKRGQMMTGKQTVKNNGEEYHFYFRENGMAYTAIIVDGSLYALDGVRYDPTDGNDYEIISVQSPTKIWEKGNNNVHSNCRLIVNASGKLKKSGTVTIDGIKYTVENYEIIKEEADD